MWTRQEVLRVPRLWTLMVSFALALAAVFVLGGRAVRDDP